MKVITFSLQFDLVKAGVPTKTTVNGAERTLSEERALLQEKKKKKNKKLFLQQFIFHHL